jgi:hypothetical protein
LRYAGSITHTGRPAAPAAACCINATVIAKNNDSGKVRAAIS